MNPGAVLLSGNSGNKFRFPLFYRLRQRENPSALLSSPRSVRFVIIRELNGSSLPYACAEKLQAELLNQGFSCTIQPYGTLDNLPTLESTFYTDPTIIINIDWFDWEGGWVDDPRALSRQRLSKMEAHFMTTSGQVIGHYKPVLRHTRPFHVEKLLEQALNLTQTHYALLEREVALAELEKELREL